MKVARRAVPMELDLEEEPKATNRVGSRMMQEKDDQNQVGGIEEKIIRTGKVENTIIKRLGVKDTNDELVDVDTGEPLNGNGPVTSVRSEFNPAFDVDGDETDETRKKFEIWSRDMLESSRLENGMFGTGTRME